MFRRGSTGRVQKLAVYLSAFALICAGSLSSCGNGGQTETTATGSGLNPQHESTPASPLRNEFLVLRRDQKPPTSILEKLVPEESAKQFGLDPGEARVARRWGHGRFFVVPGTKLVCLLSEGPLQNCWPRATVASGQAFAAAICIPIRSQPSVVVFALLPDGISRVAIVWPNGHRRLAPVVDNVAVARIDPSAPLPQHVRFRTEGRFVTRLTGIPSDVARRGCTAPSRP